MKGKGDLKSKFLKESMKQNWNFQRGGVGLKLKNPLWEGYGDFLVQHIKKQTSMFNTIALLF